MQGLFDQIKTGLVNIDPVAYCENNLMLDNKPFRLRGNGYKPFADIFRYIGLNSLKNNAKPIILVKGRQVGATTMAAALELYFMSSGLFGTGGRAPMRIIHAFPTLIHVFQYAKTKFNPMIRSAVPIDDPRRPGKKISVIENRLDKTSPTNDSLQFKQFYGDNFIRIESTGRTADRLRGGTIDCIFYDECFPYSQNIVTSYGKMPIGKLFKLFKDKKELPEILSYNENTDDFEYKKIKNAWKRDKRKLLELTCENRKIKCTPNHRFLTINGWKRADELKEGSILKTTSANLGQISYCLNSDQEQIMLGSFLGDGCLSNHGINKYRLVEQHGMSQENYCDWKASMFEAKPYVVEENGFSKKQAKRFSSKLFSIENKFPKNKTTCPQWVLDKLDERGLAIWFMDDGSVNKQIGCVLNTCSFDEDSQKRMVDKLTSMGIECEYRFCKMSVRRSPGYYSIFLNSKGYKKLCELIMPYVHKSLYYKVKNSCDNLCNYSWNNKFKNYGLISVKKIKPAEKEELVYDIEVEDNHNFIATSCKKSKNSGGIIAHNCQDIPAFAMVNANKTLTTAQYGKTGKGIQVYFGTPKSRSSEYYKMWESSTQAYYHLGCEKCENYFPLYTPGSNEWEKIWLHGFIVKCPYCDHTQDKRHAAERGKWIHLAFADEKKKLLGEDECDMIGFHINQLYNPRFTKEDIIKDKPENSPIMTERGWQNEVLGEFYAGEMGPITKEEIEEYCADDRKLRASISIAEGKKVFAGFDWGKRNDPDSVGKEEADKQGGQSFSTCVILTEDGPGRLLIDYASIVKKNDFEYKKGFIHEVMRKYSVTQAVGDIGYAHELTEVMQRDYGDRFLASNLVSKVNGFAKLNDIAFPHIILAEREYHIAEVFNVMKRGMIRFPWKDFEKISWLIDHCTSMEVKVTFNVVNEPVRRFVKGAIPNDGFMALLNAYLAYKYYATGGFNNMKGGVLEDIGPKAIPAIIGYCPRM